MRFISSSCVAYKPLPPIKNIFMHASFFSCLFLFSFIFIAHLFRGLVGAYVNGRFSLLVHSLVCPITHSSLDGFQPNLVQHFPHVYSTCHTIFNLKKTLECVYERLLHCRLIFAIPWPPENDLYKLSVTQSILMYHSVLKVKKIAGLSFSKLSFKVTSAYMLL